MGALLRGLASLAWAALLCGCDGGGSSAGSGGAAGAAGAGGGASGGSAGSAGAAGSSGAAGAPSYPKPEPADVSFSAGSALPSGEQLLFSDWNASPNTVSRIGVDGGGEAVVFRAYRIWSLGANADASRLAFACGDPQQAQNYGIALGDAIQHTWLYDTATQSASVLSWGNLNDECHRFNATSSALYVCRRYDFEQNAAQQWVNKGYQLGRLQVADGAFELLTPVVSGRLELHPVPSADETLVYFTRILIAGGSQQRTIVRRSLSTDEELDVRPSATLQDISPDFQRMVFQNSADQSKLWVSKLDGSEAVRVADRSGTNARFSPDGQKVAFLYGETQSCSHIEIVAADGSEEDSPTRVRDCGSAFVADLLWIDRP
ncbi:MAG: hypothetical protein KF718_24620 [Polyangiaceae bacterium]|nr:hypothetical protein [Polyangiaceae bacterium]